MSDPINPDDCNGCPVDRRTFLRDLGLLSGTLAALAALAPEASALPVHSITAISVHDELVSYLMPVADGVFIDKKKEVIVARSAGQVYAFMLACPHQNTALRWSDTDHRFQCPKHHSQYAPDGTYLEGRATRSMDRFAVTRDGANLVVNLDKVFEQDRDAAGWKSATVVL